MIDAKEQILADAIECYIEAERKIRGYKRALWTATLAIFFLIGVLIWIEL